MTKMPPRTAPLNDELSVANAGPSRCSSSIRRVRDEREERVLVLGLRGTEAELANRVFAEGEIRAEICQDAHALGRGIEAAAGAVLLTEEALAVAAEEVLPALAKQPPWSDLPVIVSAAECGAMRGGLGTLGCLTAGAHVILLERPVGARAMVQAVQGALRVRRRQYDARRLMEELAAAREQADESRRAKQDFLATVSHELRTPLNAILGWTRMLRRNVLTPEKRQRALDTIERNAVAQMQLVEDLLDVSCALARQIELDRSAIDMGIAVRRVVDAVRPAASAKRLGLDVALTASPIRAMADSARMRQVVWNLLDNAIKFTPPGGHVRVQLERTGPDVVLTVSDDGVGIAPEFRDRLFGPFRQADSSTTRAQTGLGVGLLLVKHLVELHGGDVRVSSDGVGRGATFAVSIPAAAERTASALRSPDSASGDADPRARDELSAAALPPMATGRDRRLAGLCVVVVDDGRDRALWRALEVQGAIVVHAQCADEAIAIVQRSLAHVIIFDCPSADDDAYAWIRGVRDAGCALPAVALTAHARVADRSAALVAGFDMHLPKPVDGRELVDIVEALVDQFGAGQIGTGSAVMPIS